MDTVGACAGGEGTAAWDKIVEEMREREQQDFEDDKAALFLNGRKAGPMEKMGL